MSKQTVYCLNITCKVNKYEFRNDNLLSFSLTTGYISTDSGSEKWVYF